MRTRVIDSIKLLVELISPSRDEMSTGDVRWHVNTLREDNRQLQEQLHKAQQQRTEALEKLEESKDSLHAYRVLNDELRTRLRVPAGRDILEYVKTVDVASVNDYVRIIAKLEELLEVVPSKIVPAVEDLQELATIQKDLEELDKQKSQNVLEEEYKALVATMASVRRITNAADNVDTVEQVGAVMGREILAQARERNLVTDKLELSKSVRRYKSEYSDLLAKWTFLDERCAALTNEVAELHKSKLSMAVAFEALERDKLLADASAERARASAEEAAELAERWESKSKEWYAALEAERKTVASLLEDRRRIHEANKRILALTGAHSHETPVAAVERIIQEARKTISWEREQRELERANNVVTEQMEKELSRSGG